MASKPARSKVKIDNLLSKIRNLTKFFYLEPSPPLVLRPFICDLALEWCDWTQLDWFSTNGGYDSWYESMEVWDLGTLLLAPPWVSECAGNVDEWCYNLSSAFYRSMLVVLFVLFWTGVVILSTSVTQWTAFMITIIIIINWCCSIIIIIKKI